MVPPIAEAATQSLGLDRIVRRLVSEDGLESKEAALQAIAEYERIFFLAASRQDDLIAPSLTVDLVWQRHMLDTKAYSRDCQRWAGVYLHRESVIAFDTSDRGNGSRCGRTIEQTAQSVRVSVLDEFDIQSEGDEPGSRLEKEDFSDLILKMRLSLQCKDL